MKSELIWRGFVICFILFLLLPAVIVIPASFNGARILYFPPRNISLIWYQEYITGSTWLEPTRLSFVIAIFSSAITLAIATPAAFALTRIQFVGRDFFKTMFMLPWVAPQIVVATGIYILLLRLHLGTPRWAILLAHVTISFPIALLIISSGLERLDKDMEDAAASLGASQAIIWRRVIIPSILPSLLAAAMLTFIISWDEVLFAWFLGSSKGPTLPAKIFSYLQIGATPLPAAISTILLSITGLVVSIGLFFRSRISRKETI